MHCKFSNFALLVIAFLGERHGEDYRLWGGGIAGSLSLPGVVIVVVMVATRCLPMAGLTSGFSVVACTRPPAPESGSHCVAWRWKKWLRRAISSSISVDLLRAVASHFAVNTRKVKCKKALICWLLAPLLSPVIVMWYANFGAWEFGGDFRLSLSNRPWT